MKLGDIPFNKLISICSEHYCCDVCPLLKDGVCMLSKPYRYKDVEVNIDETWRHDD